MFKVYSLINYIGIVTFILLCLTLLLGITQISYNLHIIVAVTAFLFACFHVGINAWFKYKRKKGG